MLTVFGAVNTPNVSALPAVVASMSMIAAIVPQFAVGVPNVMALLLLVVPLVPVLAVLVPEPCVPAKLASDEAYDTRA